jgi:hypothetical protein
MIYFAPSYVRKGFYPPWLTRGYTPTFSFRKLGLLRNKINIQFFKRIFNGASVLDEGCFILQQFY